jgi:hypothetical protein
MRITESNMTLAPQWAPLRLDQASMSARVDARPAPEAPVVAAVNLLDNDRDGWLDEDDVPYDQLQRLERKAEADAEIGAIYLPAATPTAPAAPDPRPAPVEPQRQGGAGAAAQIDLLA